ncbi:MAG: hypothetical protein WC675_02975 [Patescibacteria group bacterium]|jgi:hypothetical protein
MRKIFLRSFGLVIFSLALLLPLSALAAAVTYDAAVTVSLPNTKTLTITNGSLVESLTINNDSTLTVGLASDSNITFQSSQGYLFSVSVNDVGSYACDSVSASHITLTSASTQSVTLTVSDTLCSTILGGGGSTGGGGGGGGAATVIPSATSVKINNNDAQTENTAVTLTLAATNAATMLIANKSDFTDAGSWVTYATSKSWTLTSGVGTKTVYVKFRSSSGGDSTAVSDSIELVAPAETTTGNVTAEAGGTTTLSDGKLSVVVPSGAVSGSGSVTIDPTTSYTAPTGDNQVVGSKVYDLALTVGGTSVTTFSKKVALTFAYTDEEIKNISESTLAVYYWDTTGQKWLNLGGTLDAANNKITVETAHFTLFALIGTQKAEGGELVKLACAAGAGVNDPCKAVYYLGSNGKRYVFPHEKTYKTWYADFSTVKTVSATELASYAIGGNVTYRPGVKLVKIQTDPKVYAVAQNGTLMWVKTAAIAEALYGASWPTLVEDVPDSFFINYKIGTEIAAAADFDKTAIQNASPDINTDKGL